MAFWEEKADRQVEHHEPSAESLELVAISSDYCSAKK